MPLGICSKQDVDIGSKSHIILSPKALSFWSSSIELSDFVAADALARGGLGALARSPLLLFRLRDGVDVRTGGRGGSVDVVSLG